MIKHYESIQGDHAGLANKLNEVGKFCQSINFINAAPVMMEHPTLRTMQIPGLLCLIEFTFATTHQREEYEKVMRAEKPKLHVNGNGK